MKQLRVIVLAFFLLAAASAAFADGLTDAWRAFVQPAVTPEQYTATYHYHQARERAINPLVAIPPGKRSMPEVTALGYFHLRDFQYNNARDSFEYALKHNNKDPLLRYLFASTKAILLVTEPEKMQEQGKGVIEEFKRLSGRDPNNAMPLIQAASVAFDCNRIDLALPLINEALKKPEFRFYQVPLPDKLDESPVQSAKAWWWVQAELWNEMVSRTANCTRGLLQRASRHSLAGDPKRADELYQQAVQVAALLTRTSPANADAAFTGLELERQTLLAQSTSPGVSQPPAGQLAKIEAAQRELERKWRELQAQEQAQPPVSVEERLAHQKSLLEAALAGL